MPEPDPRQDPAAFDRHIRHIPDDDLLAALDFPTPSSNPRALAAWAQHWQLVRCERSLFTDRDSFLALRSATLASIAPHAEIILSAADHLLRHQIQGWGDLSLQHGPVVDFNAPYGPSGQYGFHYWFWSQPLLHAFLLTSEDRYLAEFELLFNQWYQQRDTVHGAIPDLDVVFYELGLGLRNRTFLEFYFLSPNPSPETHQRMLKTLLGAARWLYHEQLRGYRDGNWQIMGSYGLAFIARSIPEFRESPAWLDLALTRLREHADRDFFPDGCHSERVPSSYSVVAYRDLRNLVTLLGPDHRFALPFRDHLARALSFFRDILPPDRFLPAINDGERQPLPAALAADLSAYPPASSSVHFPASGFTALRSDASPDALYMLINHGPHGGGHSHADCLSFQLHAFGRPLAIDSGIGRTYDDPLHAPWYVTSPAHNMLVIDSADLHRPAAVGEDLSFSSSPDLDFFAASHRGYLASHGVLHRRHIALVRRRYFLIYDTLELSSPRTASFHLHLPFPDRLLVLPFDPAWLTRRSAAMASVRGLPGFSVTHAEIPWLSFEKSLPAGTASFAVVLFPLHTPTPPPVRFTGDAGRYIVEHDGLIDHIFFDAHSAQLRKE